ncbi:uncharacterized protein B0H64DRAFT_397605 [Chaetomium fimeti]|uniref:Uncharacterized protein n=1 Tax=Chaetomium fimeti TaxID=1854472 RepID=A0AAE0HGI6_9PEZI|nr:hypothetical protein B0H64DRAFT_397605 [Chaetomium fimeti]
MVSPDHEEAPHRPEAVDASTASTTSTKATTTAAATENDRPVRVLVQTRTHLVPGDKSANSMVRTDAMENLICQHVWQRDFDDYQERGWDYNCEFAWDSVECWFLVDHHGPDSTLPPDPPVLWYKWTGKEFVTVHDPLPRRVRRRIRSYPFTRIPPERLLNRRVPRPIQQPREFSSRAEEIRVQRHRLRDTLACNLMLTEDLARFAKENPGPAQWVRARVPPTAWARLDDPSQIAMIDEEGVAYMEVGSLGVLESLES